MSAPLLIFAGLFGIILFGGIAILFSIQQERSQKLLDKKEKEAKRRIYEISTLKAIQDRIGYSLDIVNVVDTITSSLKNLFPYSTVSSLIMEGNELVFKVTIEETVNARFLDQVKKNMKASLATLMDSVLPSQMEEIRLGLPVDENSTVAVASFFNIPLVISGKVVGLINISSTQPGLYKDPDMTMLYQMTNQASSALSKLQSVIATEESKLLAMIGSLSDGIFVVDNTNQLTIINDKAKKILGITSFSPNLFEVVRPLSKTFDFGARLQQAMKQNNVIALEEISVDNYIIQATITPVLGPLKEESTDIFANITTSASFNQRPIIGASVTLHDVTTERQLARMKEDFTSSIVHELRSPLTAMKAASELMISEKEKLDSEQKEKLIAIMHQQSLRMLSDINSLLDAAKLESGHFTLFQKPNDINDMLHNVLLLFSAEAKEKGVSLNLDTVTDIPEGYFDPNRIEQVLHNLISNSLKFTPTGGTITVKARKYFNDYLPTTNTNPGILVSVADSGIGIPKEKQGQLFSKFAQIENVGQMTGKEGTGLGLYITKGIVEAHGGNIFLQSIPQHGTTVSFTLPLAHGLEHSEQQNSRTAISTLQKVVN